MKYFFEDRAETITQYMSSSLDFAAHLHSHAELGYAAEGRAELYIEDRRYVLEKGDMFCVFPNLLHRYEKSEGIKAYVVIFSAELLHGYTDALYSMRPAEPVLNCGDTYVQKLFELLFDEQLMPASKRGLVIALMDTFIDKVGLERQSGPDSVALRSILSYCDSRFTENISIESAAREMHMSRSHIAHTMRSRLDTSFGEYINMKRTEFVCGLMLETDMTVTDAAYAAGFGSVRNMNRVFKRIMDCTPREYREGAYRKGI